MTLHNFNGNHLIEKEVPVNLSVFDLEMHPNNSVAVLENEISPSNSEGTKNITNYLGNIVPKPSDDESDALGNDKSNKDSNNKIDPTI